MRLRQWVNRHPTLASSTIAAPMVVVGALLLHVRGGPRPAPTFPDQFFFSTDDGATVFADDISKNPPFDHGGSEAVRAHVYTADGGKHRWVAYLEKSDGPPASPVILVKAPGKGEWSPQMSAAGLKIIAVRPPERTGAGPLEELQP